MRSHSDDETLAKPRGYALGEALARALAPALLIVLSGCVVPYGPVLHELEAKVNHPPVILQGARLEPPRTQDPVAVDVGPGCQRTKFAATVIDYDGDPDVSYRWVLTARGDSFVIPTRLKEGTALASEGEDLDELVPGLGAYPDARAYQRIELEITPELLVGKLGDLDGILKNTGETTRTHMLELWVSDRRFLPGDDDVAPVPEPEEGEPDQLPVNAWWQIAIEQTDCTSVVEDGS